MPTTIVRVRKWGNSRAVRFPEAFVLQRSIVEGAIIEIDGLRVIDASSRRRSGYDLKDILKRYTPMPKELDFARAGNELA